MNEKINIMKECIKYAKESIGYTLSNPLVGACVVDNSTGQKFFGRHLYFGGPHAEVDAINNASKYIKDFSNSTIYVTLEPCSTYGKTPPCVNKIIDSGIMHVVIGVLDPNPKHAGQGIKILKEAGINVEYGICSIEAAELIEDFIKFQNKKLPYITLKTATSLDGKIATRTGSSKWITNDKSRETVHYLRRISDAVLSGIETVLADDPQFLDRRNVENVLNIDKLKQPARIILDSNLRIPINSKIIESVNVSPVIIFALKDNLNKLDFKDKIKLLENKGIKVILINGVLSSSKIMLDINEVLKEIYNLGYMNVLVEAGSLINGSFFDNGAVDKLELFMAPIIIGGKESKSAISGLGIEKVSDAIKLKNVKIEMINEDIRITSKVHDYSKEVVDFTLNFK